MSLNLRIIGVLLRTELRMIFRDRRILFTSILLPILATPLLMVISQRSVQKRESSLKSREYFYSVGGEQVGELRTLLQATRERLATNTPPFKFTERAVTNTAKSSAAPGLVEDEIQFGLTVHQGNATNNTAGGAKKSGEGGSQAEGEDELAGSLAVNIHFRGDRDYSAFAAREILSALRETRRLQRSGLLRQHSFPIEVSQVGAVETRDVADKDAVAGRKLGTGLMVLLFFFVMTGGAVVAADSIAGEKERGTLETLLTSAASRMEILLAKQLSVLVMALLITVIQVGNLFALAMFKVLPGLGDISGVLNLWVVLLLILLCLPMAALVCNALLLVSGYAKTYKEAQMYLMPMILVGILPALAPMLPGASLRSVMVLVPMANLAVGVRDVLSRQYDWPMLALAWIITTGTAVWLMRWGVRFLLAERMITSSGRDAVDATGGLGLYERHVWRWFGLIWACLILISGFTEKMDLRVQIVTNLILLFLGCSLLILRYYRLPVREALAFRFPRPLVWLGVLIAVPSGYICAIGVFELANLFIPAPQSMVEQFGSSLLPPHIPKWQILLGISVLPGICEEITFRGVLLHGLHRRLHPALLVVVVGLVFGVFHVALFRFVPTAALGMMFAAVTMLTGSIYPAMVWHALNNAQGVTSLMQIPEDGLGVGIYLLALGLLATAFWIFWRERTPYPGLRPWRKTPSCAESSTPVSTKGGIKAG